MNLQNLAEKVAGYSTVTAISLFIDDLLWPAIILWQGMFVGGIIMFGVALLVNLALIWAYNKLQRDLFGFEALRGLTEKEQTTLGKKLLTKLIRVGRVPAFVAISFYDPFLSVIYMRKGAEKYAMSSRDWAYFALAMFIACAGWTFCWQIVISAGELIWNLV